MTRTSEDEFDAATRRQAWRRCGGRCEWPGCGFLLAGKVARYDHIRPVWAGGKPELSNCQVLCTYHHDMKSGEETTQRCKADRALNRHANVKRPRQPMPGSRLSKWKRKLDGSVVRRDG